MTRMTLPIIAFIMLTTVSDASGQMPYRRPPQAVLDVLAAAPFPSLSVSPTRDIVVIFEPERYPPIAELARPMVRLAGLRIDPTSNGPARPGRTTGLYTIVPLDGGERREVRLPAGNWDGPYWAPDGQRFAIFGNDTAGPLGLKLVEVATGRITSPANLAVNPVLAEPIVWLPGSQALLVATVPASRGPMVEVPKEVIGPVVQETTGQSGPARTYQDLLKDTHDEHLFEYFATSQLVRISFPETGVSTQLIGEPGLITSFGASPDGKYLLVSRLKKPFSYLLPYSRFPRSVEVWNLESGEVVKTIADLPLQDAVPIEGVPTGRRSVRWLPTEPSTLFWAEARDDGDPRKQVPFRDALFTQAAPFTDEPKSVHQTVHRFAGVSFFADGRCLVSDYDRDRKWSQTVRVDFRNPGASAKTIFDRSVQDRYNDPGSPVYRTLPDGHRVLRTTSDGQLLLIGAGAGPSGDRPFLDRFDPETGKKQRLFHCREEMYESVAAVLDDSGERLLIRRESPTLPPNYYLGTGQEERAITEVRDPFPALRGVKKTLITTKRADGVGVSFTLYLPANVKPGEKLPTLFWAYPREFASADTAGQVSGSPNRFFLPSSYSHLFFLTQGYAVMDEVAMPVVGPPETANDNFVEQLVMNARAAIDAACDHGPIDRDRIGIGGHSYGAFMTASLLAHSDLFRAGIARSGAYNRTLTPFGFQNERRTFWEATDVYVTMSPFSSAHKIREPILFIHGADDDNAGTFPMQSERMYQAVRGNGGIARLVLLPHESHGYRARESVEHTLAEMLEWFDKHVKKAGKER